MKKVTAGATTVVLTLALAMFTGAALAGGHGGGGGDRNGNGGGHAYAGSHDSSSHDAQGQRSSDSGSSGVEPSSTTQHDTNAPAGSDRTKEYGNGKTAGQVAEENGAAADTNLHGPGNSQPHKVKTCDGHEVDVHALKAHGGTACGSTAKPEHAKQPEHAVEAATKTKTETSSKPAKTHYAAHEQVYICHATGSATNPYVLIHVSKNAEWAHTHHQDGRDIVLGDTVGNGCPKPAEQHVAAATQTKTTTTEEQHAVAPQECTRTVTVEIPAGVKHFVGPKGSGRYVVIHPSPSSAHYENKHPDELVYATRTVTVATDCSATRTQVETEAKEQAEQQEQTTETETVGAAATTVTTTTTPSGGAAPVASTSPAAQPTGGVLGARATVKPKTTPSSGGVLGAAANIGQKVGAATLPFTGFPLWASVLAGLGVLALGLAVRRGLRQAP